MTNDSQQLEHNKDEHGYPVKGNGFDKINTLNVFSSADMVNWTDHGEISVAGKGAANLSWAPVVGHKTINGKEKLAGDGNTWTDVSCNAAITGQHNLYLVFKGGAGQLMYADYWKFDTKSGGSGNDGTQLTPEQQSQVDAVIALINKIGTVTGDQASKAAIDAARAAYDKLTDEQKKQVTNFNVLTEAEKTYQEIKEKEDESPVKKGQSYNSGNCKNVTKIGANAFSRSKKLKKVTINSTVLTTIDKQSFYNCKKLATVKIVFKRLKTVAKQSFKGTAKKIKVDVPNSKKKAYKKLFKKNSGISSKAVFK